MALVVVAALIGPGVATGTPATQDRAADWPPSAWVDGDVSALTLHEITLILSGARPGTPEARHLAAELERLDDLPPVYREVARITLEGTARAHWHQQQALRDLSAAERAVLAEADALAPMTPALEALLQRMDQ